MTLTPADLRHRYGLGPHDLARDPGDLADLIRAVRLVTGSKVATVAAAVGCTARTIYNRSQMPVNSQTAKKSTTTLPRRRNA